MQLLLDSHAFVWFVEGSSRLSQTARRAVQEEAVDVWVSYASVWELSIKQAVSRLELPDSPDAMAGNAHFRLLPIALPHVRATSRLPRHHGDPFDRMLVAQALEEGLTLVTADAMIRRYPVAWLW